MAGETQDYAQLKWLDDGNRIVSGESTMSRGEIVTSAAIGAGTMNLSYFTAKKTETVSKFSIYTSSVAAAATPTLCRMGLYSVTSTGDLTLVASTVNDTTLFAAANTQYQPSLSTPYTKIAGQRYAIGILVVTSVAVPNFLGANIAGGAVANVLKETPAMCSIISGLSDLPSTYAGASTAITGNRIYSEVRP